MIRPVCETVKELNRENMTMGRSDNVSHTGQIGRYLRQPLCETAVVRNKEFRVSYTGWLLCEILLYFSTHAKFISLFNHLIIPAITTIKLKRQKH